MLILRKVSPRLFGLKITNEHGVGNERLLVEFSWLDEESQLALLQPAIDYYSGRRYDTQVSTFSKLRALFRTLQPLGHSTLPRNENDWQIFMLDAFSTWMTRKCTASVTSQVLDWNTIFCFFFKLLQSSTDLIPLSVIIPEASRRIAKEIPSSFDPFIGHTKPIPTFRSDQLVVTLDLERTDAEYLDEICHQLTERSNTLEQCCIVWWTQIEEHYKYGQALLAQTDWPALQAHLSTKKYREYRNGGQKGPGLYHIANGDNDVSLGNLLTLISKYHERNIKKDLLSNTDYLPHLCSINIAKSAPTPISPIITPLERINWMLGNLSPTDIIFAMLLLTIQQPKLTPSAIQKAKLADKNGNLYLEIDDFGLSFRVDKHRANAIKTEHLTEQSSKILELITEMNAYHRIRLNHLGAPLANSFFISTVAGQQRGFSTSTTKLLTGSHDGKFSANTRWLGDYFPQIINIGISKGSLSLRKLRATQGVLEWFKTRSAESMARKLGNSKLVSIENYLPKSLLAAWHTRLLRRFQNIWLAVASANESYQLSVTDFSDLPALHSFLLKMLELFPGGSSPLANELHKRISQDENTIANFNNAVITIPTSSMTLYTLYLYKEAAMSAGLSPKSLHQLDSRNGLSPNDLSCYLT